jgi:hypothetical protein
MPTNQSAILLITYNFKMFMLFENLIKLPSFIVDENSENVQNRQVQSIMFVIMSSEGPGVRAVHPNLGLRPQFQVVLP